MNGNKRIKITTTAIIAVLAIVGFTFATNSFALSTKVLEENKNCTGRAIQNTSGGSMSEASIINFKRNSAGFKLICETGTKSFPGFGCQDEKLVAYAPYDNIGDLYMYTASPTIGSGRLEPITDYIAKDKFDGGTYFKNNLIDTDTSISNPNITVYNSLIPSNTVNLWEEPSSFMSMVSGERGVIVNGSGGQKSYMNYDLSKLNLGDSFTIEMSVRGGALGRHGGINSYNLFNTSNYIYAMLDTTGNLSFGKSSTKAIIGPESLNNLNPNAFYTIRFTGDSSGYHISIPNTSIPIASTEANVQMGTGLWIGSNKDGTYGQWNDIIDSVKIYKY